MRRGRGRERKKKIRGMERMWEIQRKREGAIECEWGRWRREKRRKREGERRGQRQTDKQWRNKNMLKDNESCDVKICRIIRDYFTCM